MASKAGQREYEFDLSGGDLSLDFVNTVSRRSVPERREDHLGSYADLVAFARQSKLISKRESEELRDYAHKHRTDADRLLRKAVVFRESLYRTFSLIAAGRPAAAEDLKQIDLRVVDTLVHRQLSHQAGGYRWSWTRTRSNHSQLEWILWPIVQAGAELLTSAALAGLRQCEASDCDWLFLDNSRNHSRRWCDMKICGNREKARRHYRHSRA